MTSPAALWAPPVWTPPEPEPAPPETLVWNRAEPTVYQTASWTCSCASTAWAWNSLGLRQNDGELWEEFSVVEALRAMFGYSAVTPEYGLAYADFSQMEQLWQSMGLETDVWLGASFWSIADSVAGVYPAQMNGARWGHHSGVRGFDGNVLLLANPAPSWKGVGQECDQSEFATWGPFNILMAVGRT